MLIDVCTELESEVNLELKNRKLVIPHKTKNLDINIPKKKDHKETIKKQKGIVPNLDEQINTMRTEVK